MEYKEIIQIILDNMVSGRYEEKALSEYPEAQRMIELNYMEKNGEYYEVNSDGKNYLSQYICGFLDEFIGYVCEKEFENKDKQIIQWFDEKYEIDDLELSEEMIEYICNLMMYKTYNGYKMEKYYKKEQRWFYKLKKVSDKL